MLFSEALLCFAFLAEAEWSMSRQEELAPGTQEETEGRDKSYGSVDILI